MTNNQDRVVICGGVLHGNARRFRNAVEVLVLRSECQLFNPSTGKELECTRYTVDMSAEESKHGVGEVVRKLGLNICWKGSPASPASMGGTCSTSPYAGVSAEDP